MEKAICATRYSGLKMQIIKNRQNYCYLALGFYNNRVEGNEKFK